ncbi:CooT family nickel-binding protein, partial [bacterium]|nr:CooT family nickel-binding protein [bacterium]
MCQMKVVVEKQGAEQQRFEDVSSLSVEGSTIRIATLFAEAAEVKNAAIR